MPNLRQQLTTLARRAGQIALRHYGVVAGEQKPDRSPVPDRWDELAGCLEQRAG